MDCQDARKLISAHVDGELRADRQGPLETHLRECPDCRRFAEEMRGMASLLTSALPSFSPALHDRIMATLPERTRPQVVALRWAAAAAAVIVPVLLYLTFHESTDPGDEPLAPVMAKVGEAEGVKLLLERTEGGLETEVDVDWGELRHGSTVQNRADVPALLTLHGSSAKVAIDAGTRVEVRDEPDETVITILGDGKVLADLDAKKLEKPFVVEAASGDGRIRATALGTVFEVERIDGEVEVRVHEGRVQVEDTGGDVHPVPAGKVWAKGRSSGVTPPSPDWTDPAIPPAALKPTPPAGRPVDNEMDVPFAPKDRK